jgi:hypothetical protein
VTVQRGMKRVFCQLAKSLFDSSPQDWLTPGHTLESSHER